MLTSPEKWGFPENVTDGWILHHRKAPVWFRLRAVVFFLPYPKDPQCWKACGDPQLQRGIIAEGWNLKFFLAPNNLNHNQLLLLLWEKKIHFKEIWKVRKFNWLLTFSKCLLSISEKKKLKNLSSYSCLILSQFKTES